MKTRNVCPVCQKCLDLVETPDGLRFMCATDDCCVGQFTREVIRAIEKVKCGGAILEFKQLNALVRRDVITPAPLVFPTLQSSFSHPAVCAVG